MKLASFFHFVSQHVSRGERRGIRDDQAAARSGQHPLPSAVADDPQHPAVALERACKDGVDSIGEAFSRAQSAGLLHESPAAAAMLDGQMQQGLLTALTAICEASGFRRAAHVSRMQFELSGGTGPGPRRPRASDDDASKARLLAATAHAIGDLNSMAQAWSGLSAEQQGALKDFDRNVKTLAKNLAAQALSLASPHLANRLGEHAGALSQMSDSELKALIRESVASLPEPLKGTVSDISDGLAQLFGDMSLRCAPVDEKGFAPGVYQLPTDCAGTAERWADDAEWTFIKDAQRDPVSGGVLTIDGHDAISPKSLQRVAMARGAASGDTTVEQACQDVANEALRAFTEAIPAGLRDIVLGLCSQRTAVEFNGYFLSGFPDVTGGMIIPDETLPSHFAVEVHDAHGPDPRVTVKAWRDFRYRGVATGLDGVAFKTEQTVKVSATFNVSHAGLQVIEASATV